jgi:hypothetical protein
MCLASGPCACPWSAEHLSWLSPADKQYSGATYPMTDYPAEMS